MVAEFIGDIFQLLIAAFGLWALGEFVMLCIALFTGFKGTEAGGAATSFIGDKVSGKIKDWFNVDMGDWFGGGSGGNKSSASANSSSVDVSKKNQLVKLVEQMHKRNSKIKDDALKVAEIKNFEEYLRYIYTESNLKELYVAVKYVLEQRKIIDVATKPEANLNEQSISYLNTLGSQIRTIVDTYRTWRAEVKFANEALEKKNGEKKIKSASDAIALYRNLESNSEEKGLLDKSYELFGGLSSNLVKFVQSTHSVQNSVLEAIKFQREKLAEIQEQDGEINPKRIKEWKKNSKDKSKEKKYEKDVKEYKRKLQKIILKDYFVNGYLQRLKSLIEDTPDSQINKRDLRDINPIGDKLDDHEVNKIGAYLSRIMEEIQRHSAEVDQKNSEIIARILENSNNPRKIPENLIQEVLRRSDSAKQQELQPLFEIYNGLVEGYRQIRAVETEMFDKKIPFQFKEFGKIE